jgi:hypothetical protein
MIGLSRAIKPEWLTKTVELVTELADGQKVKDSLNEYLSFEINSPTNLRKTRDILLNTWSRPSEENVEIRDKAINIYNLDSNDNLAINWQCFCLHIRFLLTFAA